MSAITCRNHNSSMGIFLIIWYVCPVHLYASVYNQAKDS